MIIMLPSALTVSIAVVVPSIELVIAGEDKGDDDEERGRPTAGVQDSHKIRIIDNTNKARLSTF